jgi:hypothetical protein
LIVINNCTCILIVDLYPDPIRSIRLVGVFPSITVIKNA